MHQMFNIVQVKLAVGFVLVIAYMDILINALSCLPKIYSVENFAGERMVENNCFVSDHC